MSGFLGMLFTVLLTVRIENQPAKEPAVKVIVADDYAEMPVIQIHALHTDYLFSLDLEEARMEMERGKKLCIQKVQIRLERNGGFTKLDVLQATDIYPARTE